MSLVKPEGPDIQMQEALEFMSVTTYGIVDGSFRQAAIKGFRTLQNYNEENKILGKHTSVVGVSPDDPDLIEKGKCRYICCMGYPADVMKNLKETDEVKRYKIPKGLYAIFLLKGPHKNIQYCWKWIIENWLPTAPFRYRKSSVPYESYLNDPENTKEEELQTEIHVPVNEKAKDEEKE